MIYLFKKTCALVTAIIIAVPQAFAGPLELFMQKYQEKTIPLVATTSIEQTYFTQWIDHQNPALGTFAQRYYIDETYSSKNTDPVFFYICGESECTKRALNGAIRTYAQKHHAKLVALEHRYYGESLPQASFSPKDLSYLSTEAALDDLAYFQTQLSTKKNWTGTWIAFGGSYPGSLSAYYRFKHPSLVAGSLASSAPVMAKENFIEYDAHVTKVAGPQCADHIRQVVSEVESALNDAPRLTQIKNMFAAGDVIDPVDFLYLIADTGAAAVQYGMRDSFCAYLANGVTPLQGYADFAKYLYDRMGVNAVEMTVQGAMSEDPRDYKSGVGMRQWYYQSCTEYGYWQNAHPNAAQSTRSSLINLDYHRKVCQRLFGLNEPVNTQAINSAFYFPLMDASVSNIYFTNGGNDPWSTLSLTVENGNAQNSNLTYFLINGAAHCEDLHAPALRDSKALVQARQKMESLLNEWLALKDTASSLSES